MSDLYDLPDGWEWNQLKNFVQIKGGKRLPKGQKLLEEKTPYPYVRVSDFNDFGSIDLDSIQYITEGLHKQIKNYIISKDDIYISIAGTIGKTGIVPNELDGANLTENAAKLVFDNSEYNKNYLLYFSNSVPFLEQIGLATKVVAMPKLALTRLKEVYIPLPPISEQQRIVSKLDKLFEKIDKAIALHQKNMDEADVFMGSVLNDVFEELEEKYENFKLKNKYTFKNGINFKKDEKDEDGLKGIKTIDVLNMYSNNLYIDDSKLYSVNKTFSEEYILKSGDILFVRSSVKEEGVGWTSIYKDLGEKLTYCGFIIRGRPIDASIDKEFITYLLRSNKMRALIIQKSSKATITNINQTNLGDIELPFPPLPIQQKVVTYLDEITHKIEKVKSIQKEKMDSLTALKASILDKAFRGEL